MGCTRNSLFRKNSIDQLVAATRENGLGIHMPIEFTAAPGALKEQAAYFNLLAFVILIGITLPPYFGTREFKRIVAPETDRYTIKSKRQPCV